MTILFFPNIPAIDVLQTVFDGFSWLMLPKYSRFPGENGLARPFDDDKIRAEIEDRIGSFWSVLRRFCEFLSHGIIFSS